MGLGQKDPTRPNAPSAFVCGREAIPPPKATSQFTSGDLMPAYNRTHYYAPVYTIGGVGEWKDTKKQPFSPGPSDYCDMSKVSCVEGQNPIIQLPPFTKFLQTARDKPAASELAHDPVVAKVNMAKNFNTPAPGEYKDNFYDIPAAPKWSLGARLKEPPAVTQNADMPDVSKYDNNKPRANQTFTIGTRTVYKPPSNETPGCKYDPGLNGTTRKIPQWSFGSAPRFPTTKARKHRAAK